MQYVAGGTLQEVIEYQSRLAQNDRSGATYLAAVDRSLRGRGESAETGSVVRHKFQHAAWPEVVCWLGARLASALAYAHQRGILHRDVKPANVLIAQDGSPQLADFNVSFCSKLDGATPAAYFGGSLAYMSPEQLEACDPDHARQPDDLDGHSDVYSLGIVLWELLTGSRPFADEMVSGNWSQTLANMSAQRRGGVDAAALARLPFNCPASLRQILLTCLAGNRDKRSPSAAELSRQLDLCLQPHAQRLLELPGTDWRELPRRFPVTSLILGGLVPNAAMSGLNIAYNWTQIVQKMPDADRHVFVILLMAVNAIAYAWGTIWALYLSWPVVVAMWEVTGRGRDRWRPPTPHWLPSLRARTLRLGEYAAWVSAVDWAFSGFVIPTWMRAQVGENTAMVTKDYIHFVISQGLCGLVAATLTFFLVTLAAIRTCYPRLIAPAIGPAFTLATATPLQADPAVSSRFEDDAPTIVQHPAVSGNAARVSTSVTGSGSPAGSDGSTRDKLTMPESTEAQDADQLMALGRRVWLYFGLAVAVPFLAVTVLVGLDDGKAAIGGLGIVGLVGFGLSFWLALVIRNDVAALAIASQPAGTTLASGNDSSNSFWTGSRH